MQPFFLTRISRKRKGIYHHRKKKYTSSFFGDFAIPPGRLCRADEFLINFVFFAEGVTFIG
jgi:hypothetical protein